MELDQLRQLIERAKASARDEECLQLVDYFEEFIELRHKGRQMPAGDEQFQRQLEASHHKFWTAFSKTAARFGVGTDAIKAYFENPNRAQQAVHNSEAPSLEESRSAVRSPVKRLRKNKNNVRA